MRDWDTKLRTAEILILLGLEDIATCSHSWQIWDDRGYSRKVVFPDHAPRADTLVFYDYTHRNTYLHVRVKWTYVGAFWFITPTCGVDLYIGG